MKTAAVTMKMNKKVYVGLSGGVDSAVAAYLLINQGFDVTAFTMKLWRDDRFGKITEIAEASRIADFLGIHHKILDLSDDFESFVLSDFKKQYMSGRTPNPCVVCNKYIKFGSVFGAVPENAFVATGHYSAIVCENGLYKVKKSADPKKDQTYMHYNLTQEKLARTIFPLGGLKKEQVREIAAKAGLPCASSKDSQDICFIRNTGYKDFLRQHLNVNTEKGKFLDSDGNVIGEHLGITDYTVGQRKGLGVSFGKPVFVTSIDPASNTVTLGKSGSEYTDEITVKDYNFIYLSEFALPAKLGIKVRYSQKETPGTVIPCGETLKIKFDEPVRAAAPGQSAVFYDGDYLIGGGIIV